MVTYKEKDKDLVIPASLGNFKTNGGGGGVTPEEVQIMINNSIAGYDATVQEEFNTTNSGVSENAQNIETLSGKTQEIETALENYATTAQTETIASGLTQLSGVTEQLSQSVGEKANASDLEALSGVTGQALQDIESLSAQTSGLSAQIEAISGAIPTVEVEQVVSAGTKIATVSINGTDTDLYAPEGGTRTIVLDELSQSELADLYNEITGLTDSRKFIEDNRVLYYYQDGPNSDIDVVEIDSIAVLTNRNYIVFTAEKSQLDSGAKGYFQYYFEIELKSNGTLTFNKDRYCAVLDVRAKGTAHTITYDDSVYRGYKRLFGGNTPVSLRIEEEGITTLNTNMIMVGGIDNGKLYANWANRSGETWEGEWNMQKNAAPNFFRKKEDVSVTQELSAGTKIATVTVDGVGTDLFAPAGGGSSEQNYLIVDDLSDITDPVDGMYVYVNSGTSHIGPYSAFSFDASDCTGGQFYWQDSDIFYITGDNPPMVDVGYWAVPEQDGEWHFFSGSRGNLWIKYDPQTDIYSIALPYDNITNLVINLNDNLPYTGSTETINKNYKGYFSRRINGNWIRTEYHLEEIIGDELVQAHSELVSLSGQSFTDIYWKNIDGSIAKATYWTVDWNDNQKIRVTGSVDKKTFTMSFSNNGIVGEQGSFEPKEQVYYVNFDYSQSTSAWTSDIYYVAYDIYSSWDSPKLIYARVYDTDNSKKLGMGNVMHFWHNTNDDMYYNFCFGFNFVDLNGVEWKTKWTFSQQDEPNYTLVSMTQVS